MMTLSKKASQAVELLTRLEDGDRKGKVAAVDPETGGYFLGRTVAEAGREGRRQKGDAKAVFFYVRVGSPTMHTLKAVSVSGTIDEKMVPRLPAMVREGELVLNAQGDVLLLPDTGFSGALGLDPQILRRLDADYFGAEEITLAGNVKWQTRIFLVRFGVRRGEEYRVIPDVEALELEGEKLLGMDAMRQVAGGLTVRFADKSVALTD